MIYCVDDEKLKEMFSEFGNVTSSKVIAKKMHANIFFFIDVTFVFEHKSSNNM